MSVETVSVIVSGVVALGGIAVPLAVKALDGKRERELRRDARLDELRSVLDAACGALTALGEAIPGNMRTVDVSEIPSIADELEKATMLVSLATDRLAVRLGTSSPVEKHFEQVHEAGLDLVMEWRAAARESREPDQKAIVEKMNTEQTAFFDAAAKLIGVDR